jgi:hypothetical protein
VEVIILAIITMIISAFTKRKNAGDADGKSKPFMSKPLDQQSMKKIEDYAKEVYGKVQKASDNTRGRALKEQVKDLKTDKVLNPRVEIAKAEQPQQRSGRLSVHQPTATLRNKKQSVPSLIPRTGNEVIQAIVFSEILGPPKSRR